MGFNHYSLLLLALVLLFALAAGYLFRLVILALLKYLRSGEVRKEKAETKKTRGEALKAHRTRCKMTQEFVAESLGVSRQAVSKWESGASDPSTSNLLALARLYGVSAEELLREESAQGTTAYAILVGVLVVIAIIAIVAIKGKVQDLWSAISEGINSL